MAAVTIYTKARCFHCFRAKRRLRRRGAAFREIRAGRDVAATRRELERRFGAATFPQIVIGDRHVGGADDLVRLDRSGQLARLLAGD
jgi:glutaredoxin 3